MPQTEEIKQTIYRVGDKEYKVGDSVKLPKKIQKIVLEIKEAAETADNTLESLYKNILMDEELEGQVEDVYFLTYTAADQKRKYLTSEMNRALYEYFGGFVPIQLELNEDEPSATVRERQPNENPAITAEQVNQVLDINTCGIPLKTAIGSLPGEQAVEMDYNVWRMINGMVFNREFDPSENFYEDISKEAESLEDHELYQAVYGAVANTFGTNQNAYTVMVFNGNTVQGAAVPANTATDQQLSQIYGVLMASIDREQPVFSVSCFTDNEPDLSSVETGSETGPPIKVFNIMILQMTEEGNTMSTTRFTVSGTGLTFKEFLNHEQILEKNKEMQERRAAAGN